MRKQYSELSEYVKSIVKEAKAGKKSSLSTGLKTLDRFSGGIRPGELVIIASRPGVGKSALALSMAMNMAYGTNPVPVGFFSMEMSGTELTECVISNKGKINLISLKSYSKDEDTIRRLSAVAGQLLMSPVNIYICDERRQKISDFIIRVRRMVNENNVKAVFVDSISTLGSGGYSSNNVRHEYLPMVVKRLKQIACELNISVICTCHVNESGAIRAPMLEDIRDADLIVRDADLIILLDDPSLRIEMKREKGNDSPERKFRKVFIAKQRNGMTGMFHLRFLPEYARFEENQFS